jgi:hypothetical protein
MKNLIRATESRIRHLEQMRAACEATIAAEKHLLRLQRAHPPNASSAAPFASRNGHKRPPRHKELSSRKQIVKLLEDHYPRDFDPREVSRKTGVLNRSPDGRLSTYSLLARLYQEGKIDKPSTGHYRALPPSKR